MKIKSLVTLSMLLFSTPTLAITDCPATAITRFWNDGSVFWIYFQGGGIAKVPTSDPTQDNYIALATTALATGRTISPRYTANSANCNIERNDFIGMFVN